MTERIVPPIHPGEILAEEFLKPLGVTQYRLAKDINVDPRRVNEGLRRCHPLMPFKMLLNMPLGLVSIAFGLRGPNAILYPGPEQSAAAIDSAKAVLILSACRYRSP